MAGGEPGITVYDHCLNVGSVAQEIIADLPPQISDIAPAGAACLAALHDVGKVSPGFQVKCSQWLERHNFFERAGQENWGTAEADHAKVSQFTLQQRFPNSKMYAWAAAAGAHHGQVKGDRLNPPAQRWEAERQQLTDALSSQFGGLPTVPPSNDAMIWFVAGLITIADWIGSDERNFPQSINGDLPDRRARARAALDSIGWRNANVHPGLDFRELFPGLPPNSLQRAVWDAVKEPGVYVIEAPMGYGKTEAALAAAYRLIAGGQATGLFFALPTQVTSNRIHQRVQAFAERATSNPAAVRLAHGASWLIDENAPPTLPPADGGENDAREDVRTWFASAKRALLTPFGVGTIDQAILGVIAVKHFFVRQFGLAGKVVVLDEVHAYDVYTGTLISALVKRLRELKCTVLVLSATLTEERRRELLGLEAAANPPSQAYPLVSGAEPAFFQRACEPPPQKTIHLRTIATGTSPVEALERARRGQCVLWIRNTVQSAQETYRALRAASPSGGPAIAALHSRFPYFRREELENKWMDRLGKQESKRPSGCVLVSTQVAEQSVDIDADLLITDLAPTDMLLQRMGRLWRHDRAARPCEQPEAWIEMPHAESASLRSANAADLLAGLGTSARVYAPYVLLRSHQQWTSRETIEIPGQIRDILEATYSDPAPDEPQAWQELYRRLQKEKDKLVGRALSATSVWTMPAVKDKEGVHTRYSNYPVTKLLLARRVEQHAKGSSRLILLNGEDAAPTRSKWDLDTAKKLHRNMAPAPLWAMRSGIPYAPKWLENYVYERATLGIVEDNGQIRWPEVHQPTGLYYDADQGVVIDRDAIPRREPENLDEPDD